MGRVLDGQGKLHWFHIEDEEGCEVQMFLRGDGRGPQKGEDELQDEESSEVKGEVVNNIVSKY